MEDGFNDHGITTEMYKGARPRHCEYHLTYTALRSWDFSTYLFHAELRLYKGSTRIGYAEYHLIGKGGFSLNKWASVKSKMTPIIDELLAQYENGLHTLPDRNPVEQTTPTTIRKNEAIGKYAFAAGQVTRSQNCIPKFKPNLIDEKPTSELYTVMCNDDATIVVKCTDGNCDRVE